MAACEETETVVCLHVGSSGTSPATAPDAPSDTIGVLFFGYAMFAAVDWLYSRIPVRFPDLQICLSEGGIGWVAGLLDRLEHVRKYDAMYGTWNDVALSPGRHVPPQLLGLRDRRPVGVPAARRDRRREHPRRVRLPARRLHVAASRSRSSRRSSPGCPTPRSSGSRGPTRRRCSVTRCPRRCSETRMPTDVDSSTRRSARSSAARDGAVAALRRRAVRAGRPLGCARADHRGPSRSTPPDRARRRRRPSAGLDLVPGHDPGARSPRTASPPRSGRPSLDGRAPGAGVGARRQLPDRRRVAAHATTARGSRPHRRVVVGVQLPARRARLARAPTACRRTSASATCAAAVAWVRATSRRVRRRPRPDRADGRVGGRGRDRAPARAEPRRRTLPVAGAILQSGAPAGTLDAAAAEWVARAVPRRRRASTASTRCATCRSTRCSRRRSRRVDAVARQGRHDAVPPVGRRRPPHRARVPRRRSRRSRSSSAPPRTRWSCSATRCRSLPEDIAVPLPRAARRPTSASPTSRAVRAGFAACDGDLVEAVADLELHVPNELLARAHRARGNPVWRYRFTWEAPVPARVPRARPAVHLRHARRAHGWRDFAGAHAPHAPTRCRRACAQAWTSFAAYRAAVATRSIGPWPDDARSCSLGPDAAVGDRRRSRAGSGIWLGRRATA